ncbi:DUF2812 domain-containing protein [Lacticaseibacillus pabuli]|uniref:DUF2812 domain-containing protein n=1 Tax=Lacticaseibacillus pabuli TaxID=3025672 RepID=A0ABY7WQW0_9LACO|nr:DUF2812 domain-containing protein [Lacticaseibacillus sp. KACC 23028]WDF82575.1 DUF2812 domain-containing protein [Lacticaseibacillus sp. KACC 23028]
MMRVRKHFTIWQTDQLAAYLTRMAHQGQRLTNVSRFHTYTFTSVQPLPGTVQVDFRADTIDDEYVNLMTDAGWQLLATRQFGFSNWSYWYHPNPDAKIYSDQSSTLEFLKRIRRRWAGFAVFDILFVLFMLRLLGAGEQDVFTKTFVIVACICVVLILVLCVYTFARLSKEIRELVQLM